MVSSLLPTEIAHEFQAALEGMRKELSAPLAYRVVHARAVTMRAEPSLYAAETGRLAPSEVVKGFPVGPWLYVLECNGQLPIDGAWVLIDGTALGVGDLLIPEWGDVHLENVPGGLHAQWPGIGGTDTVYYVQWRPQDGKTGNGGTVIAMRAEGQQDAVATISGIPSGIQVNVRIVACLSCGLLVGPWRIADVTSDEEGQAAPKRQAEDIPAEVFQEASRKYSDLVNQIETLKKKDTSSAAYVKQTLVEEMLSIYEQRPKDGDDAKQMVLNVLFGGFWGDKAKASAVGNTGDMFADATGLYEEGLSGECNRIVAEVVATLVRKHG